MKGLGTSAICRAAICPVRHEELCNRPPKCGGRHVESRVADVKVVSDFAEEEGRGVLACRALVRRRGGKRRTGGQAAGHFVDLAIHDMSNEIKKDRLHGWHPFLVWLNASRSPAAAEDHSRGCLVQRVVGQLALVFRTMVILRYESRLVDTR